MLRQFILYLTLCIMLFGCDNDQKTSTTSPTPKPVNIPAPAEPTLLEALQHYKTAQIHAITSTTDCVNKLTAELNEQLLPSPNKATLFSLQQTLQQCIKGYLPTHTLLSVANNPQLTQLARAINSTPILPGYVDYLAQYPYTGIVNDLTLTISNKSLRAQQGLTDNGEVSLGFEVIAFLLFGEQRYDKSANPRPATDFSLTTENEEVTRHSDRRRLYLSVALPLLQEDLIAVTSVLNQQLMDQQNTTLDQHSALSAAVQIANAMQKNLQQDISQLSYEELSLGYWQLLTYHTTEKTKMKTSTLSSYLKWPQRNPDLSREAFTAQLQTSIQRLNTALSATTNTSRPR